MGTFRMLYLLVLAMSVEATISCVTGPRAPANNKSSTVSSPQVGWRTVDVGQFLLSMPAKMERLDTKGIDSNVWVFQDRQIRLEIDLGSHPNDLTAYQDWPDYYEEELTIDSRQAKFAKFRQSPRFSDSADEDRIYIAALYFDDIGLGKIKLTCWLTSNTAEGQKTARQIFNSIKFKD